MTRPRAARLKAALVGALALLLSGCGGAHTGAAASPAPVIPGEATQGPDLAGVQLPNFVMPLLHGSVSRPSPKLTPGAVTTTDANVVCNLGAHASAPAVSGSTQTAVYTAYGFTSQTAQRKHILDWLVPYNLGGADVQANIWPAGVTGTGFYEKVQTDQILRQLVCRGELTLTQAQNALETNWYSAWLRWVVATGHI
jgi:hypothetical protein